MGPVTFATPQKTRGRSDTGAWVEFVAGAKKAYTLGEILGHSERAVVAVCNQRRSSRGPGIPIKKLETNGVTVARPSLVLELGEKRKQGLSNNGGEIWGLRHSPN